ncbi:aspartate aminotransferase [Bathymodiolus thermophilus thioautotrophic gill symbiont]|uniref:Aspartate aminotransferase n=1 Tax=Bathymodiolus thermophilus thioautotrophic gill symbiont TaxID=2360 RepID=A0A3G3IPA9_9GAMM|nr:aminotransferase class V-fold PLP-dependent enzyme [Bathymodiolus thermophilus thioautotrophic gill symbiont]AYQ57657.1 aspartate aminotransferase [Bathymodiolus thermophilus thioautotrophic gill symbiont]
MNNNPLIFKVASEAWEFDAIHRLNYQTFVEEIPQHDINQEEKLIDKFHEHNAYIVCLQGQDLLGMLSVNDNRPFSLDNKLKNIDEHLPSFRSICEIRLLSIVSKNRHGDVLSGIFEKLFEFVINQGYDLMVISGITKQARLYRHVGFQAFGDLVGAQDVQFQPMYITLDRAIDFKKKLKSLNQNQTIFNYLPGPVSISKNIMAAYSKTPISHRGGDFMNDFSRLQDTLCQRLNTKQAYITTGSGTFANDIIAAQLSKISGKGIVLVSGEFGRRIEDHARRANLDYEVFVVEDGLAFTQDFLKQINNDNGEFRWLWMVHCETSTGVLNDLNSIREWCQQQQVLLCLDAISTIGSCTVDLTDVYLASATSGKGVGSLPGLALIFSSGLVSEVNCLLPRCFDLSDYIYAQGVPYTISSNAVYGLIIALKKDWDAQFSQVEKWSHDFRVKIEKTGLKVLAHENYRAPHITTIVLPEGVSSSKLGQKMLNLGILVSYNSNYLLENNWMQVCFMGDCQQVTEDAIKYLEYAVMSDVVSKK